MARGYIRKRGDRRYQIVYDAPRGADGKRRQKYKTISGTKRQAQAQLTQILQTLNRGEYAEPTRLSLAEHLDLWLADYAEVNVRPRTLQDYRGIVRQLQAALGDTRLSDLSARQVQAYYADCIRGGLSAQTVLHRHRLLKEAISQAVMWDMLDRNVMERVTPPPRHKPELRSLTAPEVHRLIAAAASTDYHLAIHLAIHTGLRRSEILGLRWQDVDIGGKMLTVNQTMIDLKGNSAHIDVPKSRRSRRSIALGAETVMLLRSQRERREADFEVASFPLTQESQVCIRSDGRIMRPSALSKGYKRIAAACGLGDVRFHDLRHTHATMLLEAGVPVHVVQARLGHESIQTTVDTYGHVLPASDAEASQKLENSLYVGEMWADSAP